MPIRSMTAYAAGERETDRGGALSLEMRAVNHRFLEVGMRLPEELRAFEPALRERIASRVSRGKVDLSMRLRDGGAGDALDLDEGVVERLGTLAQRVGTRFPDMRVQFTELLQYPGVLRSAGSDPERLQQDALALLDEVLGAFIAAREREGAKLAAAISERVDGIARIAGEVCGLMPAIREGQKQKLEARLADLSQSGNVAQLDPGRIEQELVLWLQKLDVDEELDRLDSHVVEIRRVLGEDAPVGRRLDFLLQEFNRESNTLGSKSVDVRTSNAAVELKVLVDQIREQVQNIE